MRDIRLFSTTKNIDTLCVFEKGGRKYRYTVCDKTDLYSESFYNTAKFSFIPRIHAILDYTDRYMVVLVDYYDDYVCGDEALGKVPEVALKEFTAGVVSEELRQSSYSGAISHITGLFEFCKTVVGDKGYKRELDFAVDRIKEVFTSEDIKPTLNNLCANRVMSRGDDFKINNPSAFGVGFAYNPYYVMGDGTVVEIEMFDKTPKVEFITGFQGLISEHISVSTPYLLSKHGKIDLTLINKL